jgi:hypothetical protein
MNLRRERQLEELRQRRKASKGRPASIDVTRVREMKARGMGATAIAKALSIHRASVCWLFGGKAMSLTAEQRRALIMLAAAGQNGVPQRLLSAHGLNTAIIRGLVNRGLATTTQGTFARAAGWSRSGKFGLRTQGAPRSRPKGRSRKRTAPRRRRPLGRRPNGAVTRRPLR